MKKSFQKILIALCLLLAVGAMEAQAQSAQKQTAKATISLTELQANSPEKAKKAEQLRNDIALRIENAKKRRAEAEVAKSKHVITVKRMPKSTVAPTADYLTKKQQLKNKK